jgi:hypothetical protein
MMGTGLQTVEHQATGMTTAVYIQGVGNITGFPLRGQSSKSGVSEMVDRAA